MSTFKHHIAPITTLEWHHSDSTVFASAGEDNQVCCIRWMSCMLLCCNGVIVDPVGHCC